MSSNKILYAIYGASGFGRGVMPLARKQLSCLASPDYELVFIDDGVIRDGALPAHPADEPDRLHVHASHSNKESLHSTRNRGRNCLFLIAVYYKHISK